MGIRRDGAETVPPEKRVPLSARQVIKGYRQAFGDQEHCAAGEGIMGAVEIGLSLALLLLLGH